MSATNVRIAEHATQPLSSLVDDRPSEGIFRVHSDVYADPGVLEWEQRHIFERTWLFLGFESQLKKTFDYFTTFMGRVPVIISRDGANQIRGFVNACRHKGVKLCMNHAGNARVHVCPYHGWSYDAGGRNIRIKDEGEGGYPEAFNKEDHNLLELPQLAIYKGLIFGSLNPAVPSLEDYLGDIRFFIDLAMEQGKDGMEPMPGRTVYTYRGNWKFQFDNGLDSYHLTSTHISWMDVLRRRRSGKGSVKNVQADFSRDKELLTGTFNFDRGHSVVTVENLDKEKRPFYHRLDEIRSRVGDSRAEWMLENFNASIFPNLQIAHNSALILRLFRPLSVNMTEMTAYCLGAIGESPAERATRLRTFEDFYNATGMATPDDVTAYERCQLGIASDRLEWLQGYSRGITQVEHGANAMATKMGIHPIQSTTGTLKSGQEVLIQGLYREWARLIASGLSSEAAY